VMLTIDVQDAAAIMGEHEEHVQDLKPDRWHGEEVDGDKALGVVFEERAPCLRRRPRRSNHVLAYARLADLDSQFDQFSVDARSAPERIPRG